MGTNQKAPGKCVVVRYNEDGELVITPTDSVRPGDVLTVPSSMAYLHRTKKDCVLEMEVEFKALF